MCDLCSDSAPVTPGPRQRRRLWELSGGWHCSIIGTCLALSDLRALGRKLKLKTVPNFPVDYQLHGFFVKEADQPGKAAKMLQKLLERRHGSAVKKAAKLKTDDELRAYWTQSVEEGDIPGPYWAILSHGAASTALCEALFAEVHMLSHLVGAANRADIRRLTAMEQEASDLKDKLSKQQRHHVERMAEKDDEITALKRELGEARAKFDVVDQPAVQPGAGFDEACKSIPALQGELSRMTEKAAKGQAEIKQQQERYDGLLALVDALRNENDALEGVLLQDGKSEQETEPVNLDGRKVLYVGGRPQTVPRLRSLVASWGGDLLHHDGGMEKSMSELAGAVVAADVVIFPTDCVSHDAVRTVKRLCAQNLKPYTPIRSSGVASFVAGIRDGLSNQTPQIAAE